MQFATQILLVIISTLLLYVVLFSSCADAGEHITGNETTDTTMVHSTMRTLDARARQCHRAINYIGGFAAAEELYLMLKDEHTGGKILLGACVEFVTISTKLSFMLSEMESTYGRKPKAPAITDRVHAVAFMLYLSSIDKEANFMRTFKQ